MHNSRVRNQSRISTESVSNIILDAIVEVSRYQSNTICRGPSKDIERHRFRTSFVGFNPEKKTQKQEQHIQPENTKYMHNNSSINTFSQKKIIFQTMCENGRIFTYPWPKAWKCRCHSYENAEPAFPHQDSTKHLALNDLSERDRVPRVQRERECRNRYLSERDRVNAEESERLFLFVINDRGIFGIGGKQKAKNYIPFDRVSIF